MNKRKKEGTHVVGGDNKLEVLMMEYNNFHDKVKLETQSCTSKTIQALVSLGVMFVFCIQSFYENKNTFFVDACMCILIPMFTIGIICIALAANIKILAIGEYLITIEKKINRICCQEESLEIRQTIINWEWWRIKHGTARDRIIYYDSAFLYISAYIIGIISPVIRILYMIKVEEIYDEKYIVFWTIVSLVIISLMCLLVIELLVKTNMRKRRIDIALHLN